MVMEGLNLRASGSSWLTKQSVVEQVRTSFGEMAIILALLSSKE